MLSHLTLDDLGLSIATDIWGWTDSVTKSDYAVVGGVEGAVFVDISKPKRPDVVGILPSATMGSGSAWRDIKVYAGQQCLRGSRPMDHDGPVASRVAGVVGTGIDVGVEGRASRWYAARVDVVGVAAPYDAGVVDSGWEQRLRHAVDAGDLAEARRIVAPLVDDRGERSRVLDQLAGSAGDGSETALELLIEVVDDAGLARSGVRRVLIDEADVDDVAQDTLVSMTRSIGSFSLDRGSFVTWLFQIAHHRASDHLRRRRNVEVLQDDMGDAQKISSMIATRVSVQQKVQQLPPHYRDAVVLRDIERLSYDTVADRLGVNVNTVKSHVARGRARLAAMFGADGT